MTFCTDPDLRIRTTDLRMSCVADYFLKVLYKNVHGHHFSKIKSHEEVIKIKDPDSVADKYLDPLDPHVLGPPESGSGSIRQRYRMDLDPAPGTDSSTRL